MNLESLLWWVAGFWAAAGALFLIRWSVMGVRHLARSRRESAARTPEWKQVNKWGLAKGLGAKQAAVLADVTTGMKPNRPLDPDYPPTEWVVSARTALKEMNAS